MMSDQPEHPKPEDPHDPQQVPPERDPYLGAEDFELPTRAVSPVDEALFPMDDLQAYTQASNSVPPDLPHNDTQLSVETDDIPTVDDAAPDLADVMGAPRTRSDAAFAETTVNPAVPPVAPIPQENAAPPPFPAQDIPVRSYDATPYSDSIYHDRQPYGIQQQPPPPVYGGLEDREQRRRAMPAPDPRSSGRYLPAWSLLVLLAGVAVVAGIIIVGLIGLGGGFAPGGETPVIIIVTSTPTLPPVQPSPIVAGPTVGMPTQAVFPTSDQPQLVQTALPPGITPVGQNLVIAVGSAITVKDVEEVGLNVREGPGTGFQVLFIAPNGERYMLVDGPVPAGEFTWWKLRDEINGLEGWAVETYLEPSP